MFCCFLPGSDGITLSLLSICPASMGNISFRDFCKGKPKGTFRSCACFKFGRALATNVRGTDMKSVDLRICPVDQLL